MVKYQDLINIKVNECGEQFVSLQKFLIRESVAKKIIEADKNLKNLQPEYRLIINCGYRSLKVQTKIFLKILSKICKNFYPNPIDLYEIVHQLIAVPTVAGHPTGGAVDIAIFDKKKDKIIDFGSKIDDLSAKNLSVFSRNISKEAKKNRLLLRKIMLAVGFAPFDGEWWHFSYGDREWAFYYKKKCAIYDQIKN